MDRVIDARTKRTHKPELAVHASPLGSTRLGRGKPGGDLRYDFRDGHTESTRLEMAKKSKGVKSYAGSVPYMEGDLSSIPQLSKNSSKANKKDKTRTSLFGLGSKGVKSRVKQRVTSTRRDASNPLFVLDEVRTLRTGSLESPIDDPVSGLFDDEPRFKSEGYRPRPAFNEEPMKSTSLRSEIKSEEGGKLHATNILCVNSSRDM